MKRPFPAVRLDAIVPVVAIAIGVAFAAIAQNDMSKVEIQTTPLGDHLHMLVGAGGNIGVFSGPDGVVLIDDQYAPLGEKIRAAIGKFTDQKVRFVLNTHWHGDHTGGNEDFAKLGATIIAQDNVRPRMSVAFTNPIFGWKSEPSPAIALPILTITDSLTFHLNGEDVFCFHVPNAHTDGDLIVWFPKENVIHMADCFFNKMYPVIDVGSGGTINGMIAAQGRALKLIGADTKVIPGHGPLGTRAELQADHDMLITVRDRVKKLLAEKKTLEQIQAAKPLADLEDAWGKGFVSADLMLKAVVADLSRK